MFDRAGEKVKGLAAIVFIVSIILCLLLAIGLATAGRGFNALVFFGILILGPLSAYVECLMLFAVGEAADKTELENALREANNQIRALSEKIDRFTSADGASSMAAVVMRETEKLEEKAKQEEEHKQELRERLEKSGFAGDIAEELLQRVGEKASVAEKLEEIYAFTAACPDLLSDEQVKELEKSKEIERLYGKNAGITRFTKDLNGFLSDNGFSVG